MASSSSGRLPPETYDKLFAAAVTEASLRGIVPLEPSARRLTSAQTAAYLERLDVAPAAVSHPTLAALRLLQAAHYSRIAYENLDLFANHGLPLPPPPLNPHSAVERIVAHRRGGYCFLLVDAFAALLCSLGFCVSMHTAAVGPDPITSELYGNHVVLLVHLDDGRTFVCDVGLGDGPRCPFELTSHSWVDGGLRFALGELVPGFGVWHFTNDASGSFDGFNVDVGSSAAGSHEFEGYHLFFWLDMASPYRKCPMLLRVTSDGCLTLKGCTLTRTHPGIPGGSEVVATAADEEQWFAICRDHFFMALDGLSAEQRTAVWTSAKVRHDAWRARREAAASAAGATGPSTVDDGPVAGSMARVLTIRDECLADDIDVGDHMCEWSEARLVHFFENGGVCEPR